MPTQKTRAYIYRVLTAGAPLLGAYGIASDTTVALWLALAATILGVGLAAANTSTKDEDGAVEPGSLALGLVLGAALAYLVLR